MSQHRILIVENDGNFRKTLRECLVIAGFSVVEATTRTQAESVAHQQKYSAIIMDVRLSNDGDEHDWNGLVSARYFGQRKVPVIILSAFDKQEDIDRAYNVAPRVPPPDAFISKNDPHWGEKVVATLNEILESQKGTKSWFSRNWEQIMDFLLGLAGRLFPRLK